MSLHDIEFDQAHGILLEMRMGRTIGFREIIRKYTVLKVLFEDRMEWIITAWVNMFWPKNTGNYRDTILREMRIEWGKIMVTTTGVSYAGYVELMVGVIWTNAMTIEQPIGSLRSFIITEMIQIIKDLKEEVGL